MANLKASSVAISAVVILAFCVAVSSGQRERRPNPRTCSEAQMCCQGQNNTCFVLGMRVDRTDGGRCYCDSNCLIMGDCCLDYHHHCRSVDCVVGQWGDWTECNNQCGYGSKKRVRKVDQYPDNGGHRCPPLKQRRACLGYDKDMCKQQSVDFQHELMEEKASILPLHFGDLRADKKYSPWKGILKNLYKDYYNQIFSRPTYSSTFIVRHAHYKCAESDWGKYLKVNQTVCVECQPIAMKREMGMRCKGHGVMGMKTHWKAVDQEKCHGQWELIQGSQPQTCNLDPEYNFIYL